MKYTNGKRKLNFLKPRFRVLPAVRALRADRPDLVARGLRAGHAAPPRQLPGTDFMNIHCGRKFWISDKFSPIKPLMQIYLSIMGNNLY
jgi:hypothetical protein